MQSFFHLDGLKQYIIKLSAILYKIFDNTIIFPKFLENFHKVFVPNVSKFLTTLQNYSMKIFLNISFSKFLSHLLQ